MKYIVILLGIMYFVWWVYFYSTYQQTSEKNFNPSNILESVVIIIPQPQIQEFDTNPNGVFSNDTSSWIWAGFFISQDGKIQTANHLVEDENTHYIVMHDGHSYTWTILSRNKEQDLATIQIDSPILFSPLLQWNISEENNMVYSFWVDIESKTIIYNTWVLVQEKSKLENISNLLEISNELSPGFSGWPILNSQGKVIGINYAISEGKNYWIPLK